MSTPPRTNVTPPHNNPTAPGNPTALNAGHNAPNSASLSTATGAPNQRAAPHQASSQPTTPRSGRNSSQSQGDVEPAVVRRSDVRHLKQAGPPLNEPLPATHGAKNDPRYRAVPVRKTLAFIFDSVVHVAVGVGAGFAMQHLPQLARFSSFMLPAVVAAFTLASFVDRVLIQWASRGTLGKLLTGLCMIRNDSGKRPSLWFVTKHWLLSVVGVLALASN